MTADTWVDALRLDLDPDDEPEPETLEDLLLTLGEPLGEEVGDALVLHG